MLVNQLYDMVQFSLNMELYSNLVFYGERLLCDQSTDEVKYLLAKGYIGEGKYHRAYQLLKDTKTQQCRYLMAMVCIKLNKFIDAERALLTDQYYSKGSTAKEVETIIPYGACGYYLLGIILEKLSRRTEAGAAYKKSIEMDPFMWCSYERLCRLYPSQVDPSTIYAKLNTKMLIFNKKYVSSGLPKKTKDFSLSPGEDQDKIGSDMPLTMNIPIQQQQQQQHQQYYNRKNKHKESNTSLGNNNNNSIEMSKFYAMLDFQGSGLGNSNNINPNINNNSNINQFNISGCGAGGGNTTINNNNSNNNNNDQSINLSNNNHNNNNMTPVVHKEGYYNQIPIKNNINNPFVFSSSPNQIQLEFNSSTGANNNNNPQNQNSSTINNAISFDNSTNIHPFNINNSMSNYSTNNNNLSITNPNPNPNSNPNLLNAIGTSIPISTPQHQNQHSLQKNTNSINIFHNIQLQQSNPKETNQNCNSNSNRFECLPQLMKYYADIIKKINEYHCEDAIKLLQLLPINYLKCAWTYSMLGRCYFELNKFKECEKCYNISLKYDESRLEGMEYFSSCLWHLKDQFQCCNLAHRVLNQSQFAPETWIVLGNCFSLQKEHEIAIKFFTRATQINPSFAYAFTLCGHEYVENENYALARQLYSQALSCDERHFNAWWGLGHIQTKEQSYPEAIKYFKKALSINAKSGILHFYLASAYMQNRDINKALDNLMKAEKVDGDNAMIQYQISNIYMMTNKQDEALAILMRLDEKMPKEAAIHIMLGKVYKTKKDYQKALNHFNIAIDLDPKDSNQAKGIIEKLYNEIDTEIILKKGGIM